MTLKRYLTEGFLFFASFIGIIKVFHYLERSNTELLNTLLSYASLCNVLIALFISVIIAQALCIYFKEILESAKFMDKVKSTKTNKIDIKKLVKSKYLVLLIVLAVIFYFTYDELINYNDYSMLALFSLLIIYIPVSTILTINCQLKKNQLTLKQLIANRKK